MTNTSVRPIRVLLVDDHSCFLWGLAKLIESEAPAMAVAGKATNVADALQAARDGLPDIVLLDVELRAESGIACIPSLQRLSTARVIIVTASRDPEINKSALLAGACGVVHKSAAAETILEAIRHVHAGRLWLDSGNIAEALTALDGAGGRRSALGRGDDELSPAERRIVAAVVRHRTAPNKVIADHLHISSHTLRNHLASIYGKLRLRSRMDLVFYASENHRIIDGVK